MFFHNLICRDDFGLCIKKNEKKKCLHALTHTHTRAYHTVLQWEEKKQPISMINMCVILYSLLNLILFIKRVCHLVQHFIMIKNISLWHYARFQIFKAAVNVFNFNFIYKINHNYYLCYIHLDYCLCCCFGHCALLLSSDVCQSGKQWAITEQN